MKIVISTICFVFPLIIFNSSGISLASSFAKGATSRLELRVDKKKHARAFINGVQAVVSIGGFFEFYEQSLFEGRKRIFKGPWEGGLRENSPISYTLSGTDTTSGGAYSIIIKQVDSNAIEILMTYKAPVQSSNLGFDIVKLSGDLFKGAALDATPAGLFDADKIPMHPLPLAKRMLLMEKNRILVKSTLCDVEIEDLTGEGSILAADFRKVPWDKDRSIYFGGSKKNLSPGQDYSFRYLIQFLPPSTSAREHKQTVTSEGVTEPNEWPFFLMPPKEEVKGKGQFRLQQQDNIYGIVSGAAENVLARELAKLTSMKIPIRAPSSETGGRGIFVERVPEGSFFELPPEGYEIVISPEKVFIRGRSERACLYGAYAIMSLLKHRAGSWGIECGTIRDWPDLPVRGVCIELLKPAIRDVALMKRYLDAFSRARSNVVIFLHTPQQIRAWRENASDGAWSKEQMSEIVSYARSLHMDVWGGLGSKFKPSDFPEIEISEGANLYNPIKDRSYEYVFALYEQILQTYRPSTLLISHDEIQGMSVYAADTGRSPAEIMAMDVNKIHAWLDKRGVKTAMWGDMLLDFNSWDRKVGAANSEHQFFNSGATHHALPQISSDVLILDWHYTEKDDFESIDYFRQNGFSVIGSPWHNPKAAKTLVQSVKKYGGQGVITTNWGFWSTLSPAATTLYAPLCGWSAKCSVGQSNDDAAALAETMRDWAGGVDADAFIPQAMSLESVVNSSTSRLFEVGPTIDLRALPPGVQNFAGIPFAILPDQGGAVNNCVVVSSEVGKPLEDRLIFQGDRSVRSIAFLHTSLVEEPQYRPRKMGRYVVEYENGHSETLELLENWNVTDIRSSEGLRHNDWTFVRSMDVLIGARTGWRGFSATGVPLNLQVVILRNPYPEQKIRSIRMSSANAPLNSKIALLGLTFLQ